MVISWRLALLLFLLELVVVPEAQGCGPGRGAGRRRGPRKLTPLVFKQHVPNVPEHTLTASGLTEGRIGRNDSRFQDLVPNYNTDITFRDEEGTGADRLMTQRCKEKLNTLAISVMNQWPGTKLLVTEGWDEEDHHSIDSLHYEGRAVDITTDDRDRQKYGMLARLAVEAGFDWVYYESRSHIHCSVKSESSHSKSLGCFPGDGLVHTSRDTPIHLDQLKIGDVVQSWDFANQRVIPSEVLGFLDYDPGQNRQFLRLAFASGRTLTVTPSHLVFSKDKRAVLTSTLVVGNELITRQGTLERISAISSVAKRGVYAPLTQAGNLFVDGVLVSCYAAIGNHNLAHGAFAPMRIAHNMQVSVRRMWTLVSRPLIGWSDVSKRALQPQNGVHWYAAVLYDVAERMRIL